MRVLNRATTRPRSRPTAGAIGLALAAVVTLTLEATPKGTVVFRYLPANAAVFVDGQRIASKGSNLLSLDLPVGPHEIEVVSGDYRDYRRFELAAGEVEKLGTIEPK